MILMGDKDLTQKDVLAHAFPSATLLFKAFVMNSREDGYFFWAAQCC